MRTEDDLRAALVTLEQHAPDAHAVLSAVRDHGEQGHRRLEHVRDTCVPHCHVRLGHARGWRAAGGLAAVAAVAVAAIFVAMTIPGGRPTGRVSSAAVPGEPSPGVFRLPAGIAGSAGGAAGSARQVLLAAAVTVARAPAATGRFWETSATFGNFLRAGRAGEEYTVLEETRGKGWTATSSGDGTAFTQPLGVRLASPADRAAWRRDGSPTEWKGVGVIGLTGVSGFASGGQAIHTGSGKLSEDFAGDGFRGRPFMVGDHSMSERDLRALPADPDRLRKLLVSGYYERSGGGSFGSYLDGSVGSYLFDVTPDVLTMPVTPAVRAALYRMLAGVPGVHSLGRVRDAAGRAGVAIAVTRTHNRCSDNGFSPVYSWCTVRQVLVINPVTGMPLAVELSFRKLPAGQAWQAPGGLFSYEVFGAARWTSAGPPAPSGS